MLHQFGNGEKVKGSTKQKERILGRTDNFLIISQMAAEVLKSFTTKAFMHCASVFTLRSLLITRHKIGNFLKTKYQIKQILS